jgi:hypothetical protein
MTNNPYHPPNANLASRREDPDRTHAVASIAFRRTSGIYYFVAMSTASSMLYWDLRNQDIHATPPAIAVACVFGSAVSALTGWYFGKAYLKLNRPLAAALLVPFVVLAFTSLTAGIVYYLATPIFRPTFRPGFLNQWAVSNVFSDAISYALISSQVWIVALPLCSYLLYRKVVSSYDVAAVPGDERTPID